MLRILLAGVLAGAVMFGCGAVAHMAFQWEDSKRQAIPDEDAFLKQVRAKGLKPGLYSFPEHHSLQQAPPDKQAAAHKALEEKYKAGPNGQLLLGPTGEEMMGATQLGGEAGTNMAACLLAAFILSSLAPGTGFFKRWLIALLIGLCGWLSIETSKHLWYRFPWDYTQDALYCTLFEWGVAGLVLAAIARPAKAASAQAQTQSPP